MSPDTDYDVVIAGGGLVGLTLACGLADRGLRLAVLDDREPGAASDARYYALAYGSRLILETLGLWHELAATPIKRVHVSERGRLGMVRLSSQDYDVPALGYVVAATALHSQLQRRLQHCPDVSWLHPAPLVTVAQRTDTVEIGVHQGETPATLSCHLLVAADGSRSRVREQLGIATLQRDYGQAAVIATLDLEQPHGNTAYERFTPDGPLALLPLANPRQCTLVYTIPSTRLEAVLAMADNDFACAVAERFGERLGRVLAVGPRSGYPLSLVKARAHYRHRVAIIGNAAHSLHPIAGQGLNLGLRDVAVLAELVASAHGAATDIGSDAVLARYGAWRDADQRRTLLFTDGLARLFTSRLPALPLTRGIGLTLLELMPPAKGLLARQSMGLARPLPRLARGLPLPGARP